MRLKSIFILFSLLIFARAHAQLEMSSGNSIWKIEAGLTTFRPYSLNTYLNQTPNATTFSELRTIGIAWGGTLILERGGDFDAAYALHFFMPQENVLRPDTLKYRVGGWELMTSFYGCDLFPNVRNVDFILAPGVFWGNMRLRKYNSTGNFKSNEIFKNPFVAPMIRADLRFMLGPVAIGGRFSYRYDITKSKWKKGSSEVLPGYKCREIQYMVYIGIRLNN